MKTTLRDKLICKIMNLCYVDKKITINEMEKALKIIDLLKLDEIIIKEK